MGGADSGVETTQGQLMDTNNSLYRVYEKDFSIYLFFTSKISGL